MYDKTTIYNLALSALTLQRQISNADTDLNSNEVKTLNTHWNIALASTLQELDLDSLSEDVQLELIEKIEDENQPWKYVYRYPQKCAFFRRILSGARVDTAATFVPKRVAIRNGKKVIYSNKAQAWASIIPLDYPVDFLPSMAAMALAYKLAYLSSTLVTGKGAKALREQLLAFYEEFRGKAIETDRFENYNYDEPHERSEFVRVRME